MPKKPALIPTTYKIIFPNDEIQDHFIAWPARPSWPEIRDLIEPIVKGPLEHVTVLRPDFMGEENEIKASDARDMFVNEEGYLISPRPEFNPTATAIYLHLSVIRGKDYYHQILGPAVLFDRRIWF